MCQTSAICMCFKYGDLNMTWSWPWCELSIRHSLNQFLPLWFRSIWRKLWPKTAIFEVSTARNLKSPDFDLTLTWHVTSFWKWRFWTVWSRAFERRVARLAATSRSRAGYPSQCLVSPSPPGLLAHPWAPGGRGLSRPLLSREPLFIESRARRHSKTLDKTLQNHLSELKIEVTCKVKVRSKVKIWRFDVLGPGDQDYRTWWLKLRKKWCQRHG